ncbi:MAG: SPASM domain-containing protein [Candidatus Hydrogenedentes bacterium]|nr:SPASM domain-containing protein [Candidatus Hydrogenedentota bacterium]
MHRFEYGDKRFAIDPESCFCFECDAISWDVLGLYPETSVNAVFHALEGKYDLKELSEVIGELEWLRATKSILTPPKTADMLKTFEIERGLKRLTITVSDEPQAEETARRTWFGRGAATVTTSMGERARDAVAMLLNRSGAQKDLELEFRALGALRNPDLLEDLCAHALKMAKLAGKRFAASVRIDDLPLAKTPKALDGHSIGVRMRFEEAGVAEHVRALLQAPDTSLSRLAKLVQPSADGVYGQIIVRPNHPGFGDVAKELDDAGFSHIELDLDAVYVANPKLDPVAMIKGLGQCAAYYAKRLLQHHNFRLDPIASLFNRIYAGTPVARSDPAGTNELAVDAGGGIYPCVGLMGIDELRLGSVDDGTLDEEAVKRFDDVGSLTTAPCIRCWARRLCGGGTAAVHHALTGSYRKPYDPWCDAQRAWMSAAIAMFQQLAAANIHFDRLYSTLGRRSKPSLFTMARAALTMTIGVRPISEADAPMLTRWENWNEAAYFLFNETGIMLGTQYDREMDSLHPNPLEQELILVHKTGESFGLLTLRPQRHPGVAMAWLYMHEKKDYASDSVRKGFRALVKEAAGQQALRRVMVPVSARERDLRAFLEATGFALAGTLREALYLHGAYHPVDLFMLTLDTS